MDLHVIADGRIEPHPVTELKRLLDRDDTLVWLDIPQCDDQATSVLTDVFGFHPRAVQDCFERNHVSKVHLYPQYVFVVLHAPELGRGGHVHYIELDQFIGPNYLVTVHGPLNPAVKLEVSLKETKAAKERIELGHLRPATSFELSYSIGTALARRQREFVADLARESGLLEKRVMFDETDDEPGEFLDKLFKVWYELLAVRTIASHCSETYGRMMTRTATSVPTSAQPLVEDLADQFSRVKSFADGQKEFVHGIIEFYQTRLNIQTTTAAEQLASETVRQNEDMRKITAWVAIVAVPTAVTGFFGQNVDFPGSGTQVGFALSSALMLAIAGVLFLFFKHRKWL